jgi:hypothetical protein
MKRLNIVFLYSVIHGENNPMLVFELMDKENRAA